MWLKYVRDELLANSSTLNLNSRRNEGCESAIHSVQERAQAIAVMGLPKIHYTHICSAHRGWQSLWMAYVLFRQLAMLNVFN